MVRTECREPRVGREHLPTDGGIVYKEKVYMGLERQFGYASKSRSDEEGDVAAI